MNRRVGTAERRLKSPVTVTAWLALYSAFSVATIWGALGGFAGGVGAWMSVWGLSTLSIAFRPQNALR